MRVYGGILNKDFAIVHVLDDEFLAGSHVLTPDEFNQIKKAISSS